jgi:hypothetical protein
MASSDKKEPWETERPAKPVKHLSTAQKAKAKASARKHGRSTPSLVDNMNAAKKSTAKKPAVKKPAAKKAAVKKAAVKKPAARKSAAKKSARKRAG